MTQIYANFDRSVVEFTDAIKIPKEARQPPPEPRWWQSAILVMNSDQPLSDELADALKIAKDTNYMTASRAFIDNLKGYCRHQDGGFIGNTTEWLK